MLQWMIFALALSAVFSLAGILAEHALARYGLPRRFVWLAAMSMSIVWPVATVLSNNPESPLTLNGSVPAESAPFELESSGSRSESNIPLNNERRTEPVESSRQTTVGDWIAAVSGRIRIPDAVLVAIWTVSSACVLLAYGCACVDLHLILTRFS